MDTTRLLRWIVVIAVIFLVWKYVLPRVRGSHFDDASKSSAAASSSDPSCVRSAEEASETWGSGLRQFVNPPYDLTAWSSFRSGVETKIATAEARCSCDAESCRNVRSAMSDLRTLVGELDAAIRSGSEPPSDMVQRQASIDDRINDAADLVRGGK